MRMFAPIAALRSTKITLRGSGSLNARPMELLRKSLIQLGILCSTQNGFPPVEIQGPLRPGKVEVDGSSSSQLLTGLLLALPLCRGDSEIRVQNLQSKPYIAMTMDVISHFGVSVQQSPRLDHFFIQGGQHYKASDYSVEGDWSGAAFLLVAGAIAGFVEVKGLQVCSSQADKKILQAIASAGAGIQRRENSVAVWKDRLQAFVFEASDCPDLFPPLAVLASQCAGTSEIYGVDRLKHKESDRAYALTEILTRVGAQVRVVGDRMQITGGRILGGEVEVYGDHRMAMAAAVAGVVSQEGIKIRDWTCVVKSYPAFFQNLESLGGDIL
jgi:3-phosphoshikimate 1-carboxyvinyltransferase